MWGRGGRLLSFACWLANGRIFGRRRFESTNAPTQRIEALCMEPRNGLEPSTC